MQVIKTIADSSRHSERSGGVHLRLGRGQAPTLHIWRGARETNPSRHSDPEPFAFCHSEGSVGALSRAKGQRPKNLAQGKLREGEESHFT